MAVNWTKEQEQVINLRNRNILVSAAAGSGKTAVLVQRILKKVMDPEHPVDIDRLLIMTFTRAAAGEMRERIANALEDALCENPDNEHLQRQTTLIHTAQITTIDGFCAYVIRNYFHLIRACLIIKLYTHICPLDPGLAPEVVSQGQCGLWGAHTRKVRSWQRYFLEPESVFLEHQWLCRISPWRWRRWCSER